MELLPGYRPPESAAAGVPEAYTEKIRHTDQSCGAMKINLALSGLPNFECAPNAPDGSPGPQHRGTIHFETSLQDLEDAHREASMGVPATRPVIDMTIPSSLDDTLAPPGQHVCQLFVQYAAFHVDPKVASGWDDPAFKAAFAERCYDIVEEYAPGFRELIIAEDVLSPLDLERIVGLHQGTWREGFASTPAGAGCALAVLATTALLPSYYY